MKRRYAILNNASETEGRLYLRQGWSPEARNGASGSGDPQEAGRGSLLGPVRKDKKTIDLVDSSPQTIVRRYNKSAHPREYALSILVNELAKAGFPKETGPLRPQASSSFARGGSPLPGHRPAQASSSLARGGSPHGHCPFNVQPLPSHTPRECPRPGCRCTSRVRCRIRSPAPPRARRP